MMTAANGLGQGSGAARRRPEPNYLAIGRVGRPFGLGGELRVQLLTEFPEQLGRLRTVYLGSQQKQWVVERVKLHKGAARFKLVGCDDRTTADTLRGALVQIALEDAVPLGEDEYFEHQIIGIAVVEQDGTPLGKVTEIISTGANDVYVVLGPDGELLLPAIEAVILDVDLEADRMVVHVIEGLR